MCFYGKFLVLSILSFLLSCTITTGEDIRQSIPENIDLYISFDLMTKTPEINLSGWVVEDDKKGKFVDGFFGKSIVIDRDTDSTIKGRVGENFYDEGTLSFWFKPEQFIINDQKTFYTCILFTAGSRSTAQKQIFIRNTNRGTFLYVSFLKGGTPTYNIAIPAKWVNNHWYHLVITWKNGNYMLYIDGEKLGEVNVETSLLELLKKTSYFSMFSYITPGIDVKGLVDEVVVYRKRLTEEEIKKFMVPSAIRAALFSVEKKKSAYRIVIPDKNYPIPFPEGETLTYAAEFLNRYLERITGSKLEILRESALKDTSPSIYLGPTKYAISIIGDLSTLHPEEFIVKNIGDNFIICGEVFKGEQDRGTLFGVYEFLEKVMGVRWYFADDKRKRYPTGMGVIVPKNKELKKTDIDIRSYPIFISRIGGVSHYSWPDEIQREWHPVLRFGSTREWMTPNHSQVGWTDLYAKSHPEYFAITSSGKRAINWVYKHRSYICLTNPAVLKQMIENIERYDKDKSTASAFNPPPSEKYVYFAPNDGQVPKTTCHCPECIKYHRPERGFDGYGSELVFQFVKRYAEAISARWPGRKLVTLAYSHYREPPEEIELPDNVNIVYVIGTLHYGGDPEIYKKEIERIKRWYEKVGRDRNRLGLWLNIVSPSVYTSYVPFMYQDVLKKFIWETQKYVSGYFINGINQYLRRRGERGFITAVQTFPMVWIQSRLLWNPNQDPDALLRQYCEDMFGPGQAAMTMFDFYKLVQKRWEYLYQGSLKMTETEFIHLVRYPDEIMKEFCRLLDKAYNEAEEGSMAKIRIGFYRDKIYSHFVEEKRKFATWVNKIPSYNCLPVPAEFYAEDGNLDKNIWSMIPYITLGERNWGEPSDRKTVIRCLHDGKFLYLMAELYSPSSKETDFEELRLQVAVDIGTLSEPYAPNIDRKWKQFREIRFTPRKVLSDDFDLSSIVYKVNIETDRLIIEAKIPLEEIRKESHYASCVRIQFMRYWGIWNKYDTWSPILSHISDYPTFRFGIFNFIEGEPEVKMKGLE